MSAGSCEQKAAGQHFIFQAEDDPADKKDEKENKGKTKGKK